MTKDLNDDTDEKQPRGILTGVIFLIMGLLTAALMAFIIWKNADNEEFFYITTTVNGISSREYNPAFVIGMLSFGFVFALAFIILGIYMIKKRLLSIQIILGAEVKMNAKTHKIEAVEYGTNAYGKKPSLIIPRIFISVGMVLFMIFAIFLIWDRISIKSLVKTEASVLRTYKINVDNSTILGIGSVYYADVGYLVNDEKIQSRLTVSMFFNKKNVTIYYNPVNPLQCRRNEEYLFVYMIMFISSWFFIVVGGLLGVLFKRG